MNRAAGIDRHAVAEMDVSPAERLGESALAAESAERRAGQLVDQYSVAVFRPVGRAVDQLINLVPANW